MILNHLRTNIKWETWHCSKQLLILSLPPLATVDEEHVLDAHFVCSLMQADA